MGRTCYNRKKKVNAMRVWVDADACPVVEETIACCARQNVEVVLVCDSAHQMERPGARTLTVAQGADSADLNLVNRVSPGDVVVTQDYGLAALALARRARALNQDGMRYTADNIDALLLSRHTARKIRRAGGRLRGPAKRKTEQDRAFTLALTAMLKEE